MRRRLLLVAWCVLSGAAAAALGLGGAALRTGAGRRVAVAAALTYANTKLHGRLTVGAVGGSLTGGLDVRDVVLRDSAGAEVVRLARLGARYRLRDLVGGLALGQVTLDTPTVNLVERPSGRLNIEEVLGLGADTTRSAGSASLVAFHDVIIRGASIRVRSRLAPHDTVPETDDSPGGPYRVRRIEGLTATLPYVRIASPLPRDAGMRLEIDKLTVRVSDPRLDVRAARGSVVLRNDSITLDLSDARLPRSAGRVRGTLVPTSRGLAIDLAIQAAAGASEDISGLAPQLPLGVDGHGRFTVRQQPGAALLFVGDPITLVGRGGGGTATGRLGVSVGPGKGWGMLNTHLALDQFDLEYLRPLLDTLPVAGRITGAFSATGDHTALTTELDWTFRDSLVRGWPTSVVRGGGVIKLGVPGDIVFAGFALRAGHFDLGTVRRLLPAVHLAGVLDAAGTLDGAWRTLQFSGSVRHVDGARPASLARGLIRVDARGDTLGVWANLRMDSLDLTGIASELRGLPVRGAFAGDVQLAGYADSLSVQLDLAGPAGSITGGGAVTVLPPRVAARGLDVQLRRFDLQRVHAAWPTSRMNGRIAGFLSADTLRPPSAVVAVLLDTSVIGGAPFDSIRGRVFARDSVVGFDSLLVWAPGLELNAQGGVRLDGAAGTDSIIVHAGIDSLQLLAPLLLELAGVRRSLPDTVSGEVNMTVAAVGTWSHLTVRGAALAPRLRWGAVTGARVRALGQWGTGDAAGVALAVGATSVSVGQFTFAGPNLTVRGTPDSLAWEGRSRLGADAAWAGRGRLWRTPAGIEVPIDSFALSLPDQVWQMDPTARLAVRDSGVDLTNVVLRGITGAGEFALAGRHPRLGAGDLRVSITALPVADVWALLQRDPRTVGGDLSGTVELHGQLLTPSIKSKLVLKDAVFAHFQAPHIEAILDYHDHRLGGQFGLYRTGVRVVDVGIDLPLDLALTAVPERRLAGPLTVSARADTLNLEFVEALSQAFRATSGRLHADVGINGSWADPHMTGVVDVFDAGATVPSLGVVYKAVNGHLVLSGDSIRVEALSAQSGIGTIGVSGTVRLIELAHPEFDLVIEADRFHALDVRNFLALTASGSLQLKGPVLAARLTGRATITQGVLYFADLITKQVVNLESLDQEGDTTMRATIARLGLGPDLQNRFLDSLSIDALALDMGSEVWLRSSEANIALTGQLTVGKVGKQYRIDGTLQTPRGTYRLPIPLGPGLTISREFTVTRGQVQYYGTPDLNAVLDVDAQHVIRTSRGENVTAFVNIGGTLYVPKLTLTSDIRPAISETEIMSYLLVGAPNFGAVGGGAGQRVLSEAVGMLSGQLESALISDLGMPLDYLAIRPVADLSGGGLSGTEIAFGRQVFGNVFFTLSPRLCPGQQVLKNVGGSLEYRMSVEWRFAVSRDPVGGCELLAGLTTPVPYQLGLDLFWEKSH
jgi:autotransporter translocation and assembly factor TamB